MTPLHIVVITYIVLCAGTWILSLVTNEHSWVDRIWSIAPILYVGEIAPSVLTFIMCVSM